VRWLILLLAINFAVLVALVANRDGCESFSGSQPTQNFAAAVEKVRFSDGALAVRKSGNWHFFSPVQWPANSLLLDEAIAGKNSQGGMVLLGTNFHWENFLDRRLLREDTLPPLRLRVEFGEQTFLLEQRKNTWSMRPHGTVDRDALENLFRNLSLLSFRKILRTDGHFFRSEPQLVIALEGTFPDQHEQLEFFQGKGMAAVRINGQLAVELAADGVRTIREVCGQLRSRKVFSAGAGARVLWRDGEAVTVLQRGEATGSMAIVAGDLAASEAHGDRAQTKLRFERIVNLRWKDVLLDGPKEADISLYGLNRPARELEVDGRNLAIGTPHGNCTYGWSRDQDAIFSFESNDIEEIAEAVGALKAHH
jgi:hypothetical protein